FLTGIFILSAERQPIKLAWRKIVWLRMNGRFPYHSPLFFHLFNASFHHRGHGGHRGEFVL
ncbi:hypothetical protein PO170_10250, partial [Bacteroides ovatus]|nr:hypothetical protein [Bacteroides ovatus]MDC2445719.1 hypothetical protein [Bacteroides ovatus]MDC2546688.1 hypothetical protein [Bacteroides ovatus]MDC2598403.1 hypothetical protein [Bacteroides ovatus]